MLEGLHCTADTVTGVTSDTDVFAEELLSVPVMVTVWSEEKEPAVAVKFAVLLPIATATDAGTVRLAELEASVTTVPEGAAALSVTVQVDDAPEPRDAGLQARELTVGGAAVGATARLEPVPDAVRAAPAAVAAAAPEMPIVAVDAVGVNVAVTTAATPLEMMFEFIPERTHVYAAALPAHVTDFPAPVAAAPAVTLRLAMLAAG